MAGARWRLMVVLRPFPDLPGLRGPPRDGDDRRLCDVPLRATILPRAARRAPQRTAQSAELLSPRRSTVELSPKNSQLRPPTVASSLG